jgi:putative DNA primase/helicase
VEHLIESAGILCRFNVIKKRVELTDSAGRTVSLTRVLSLASLNNMNTGLIQPFIYDIAESHSFNPVEDWIRSRPWDEQDRLDALYSTVESADEYPAHLKVTLLHRWLLSAVAAALNRGSFASRGVLTLQGPQGCGKTSWGRALISDIVLRAEVFKDDHHLDGANKDSILGAIRHWITEIGELDSSFKKDIARLKGFLTSNFDKLRPPYARVEAEYPRQTVFFATVNEFNFLIDPTGNTRWWTIPVERLNFEHGLDMQQVFAQLAVELANGEQWWLTAAEEAQLALWNVRHQSVSVIREKILERLDLERADDGNQPRMTAIELLEHLGLQRPTNAQCRECGSILRELVGAPKRIKGREKWKIPLCTEERSYTKIDPTDVY